MKHSREKINTQNSLPQLTNFSNGLLCSRKKGFAVPKTKTKRWVECTLQSHNGEGPCFHVEWRSVAGKKISPRNQDLYSLKCLLTSCKFLMFRIRKGLTFLYRWKHWGQGREMICPGSHGCCKAQPALELEFPASCSSTKSCYCSGWGPDKLWCQVATGFPTRGAIKGAVESFFTLKHASDDVKKARFKPGQPEGFVWSTAEQAPFKPGFRQYDGCVSDKVEWTKFKPSIHWKG